MTIKLGAYPSDRYYLSWITQRLANHAPENSFARRSLSSSLKQMVNPIGQELQLAYQNLLYERDNFFLGSSDCDQLSILYHLDLKPNLTLFVDSTNPNTPRYQTPRVFVDLDNIEYEISEAYKNSIEGLQYLALPTRVKYGDQIISSTSVIDNVAVVNLLQEPIKDLAFEGPLYITLSYNTEWKIELKDKVYFSKIMITGTTRKGTKITESMPLRWNGTFKTINHWKEIDEVFVSYMSPGAHISIDLLPWNANGALDYRNLNVDINGEEKFRFLNLANYDWGTTLVSESYITNDFEVIRKGLEVRDTEYEMSLLDESGYDLPLNTFTIKPNTDYIFATSDKYLYIYDMKLPYPEAKRIIGESVDVAMDVISDKTTYRKEETIQLKTRILDYTKIPTKILWTIEDPSGNVYNIKEDGSFWPVELDYWIPNMSEHLDVWLDQTIEFSLYDYGTYIVTLNIAYSDDIVGEETIDTIKLLLYLPAITPETVIILPDDLPLITDLSFDSEGSLWANTYDGIYKLRLYYDYFLTDYENDAIWFREKYNNVRVEVE
jgi:hypothetical protein